MPRTVFDVPALNARQQDLEQLAAQPDFWDDQQSAQKQMRRLDEVKAQLSQREGVERLLVREGCDALLGLEPRTPPNRLCANTLDS